MRRSIGFLMLVCLAAGALASSDREVEVLARARQLQLQFRQGNLQSVDPLLKDLETAVAQSPNSADLWEALGNAYMSQQGLLYQSQPDPDVLVGVGERARDAYARALALDKKNALLLASHGMAGMSIASLKQDPSGLKVAIEEMNSAVREAPKSTPVRLTRGFTIIHLPIGLRDTAAVTADLKFVMDATTRRRPEDVLHVLLGDVYVETGQLEKARREYEQVTGASSFAAEQSRARLEDLKKGAAVSPAAIAQVRSGTGSRCAMCHAPGADN
ncbi:tetratricopeptide repeat protein [Peristeroidobacter agariperforans]|uniref:tetratricopeptide repeat protein n=1 Tax=Peristeroidobacter agariperforans TaxID=268404 RepID=UPI00101CA15E|nr:hypothetical protein [Peristeroidobacter agariperforans]